MGSGSGTSGSIAYFFCLVGDEFIFLEDFLLYACIVCRFSSYEETLVICGRLRPGEGLPEPPFFCPFV